MSELPPIPLVDDMIQHEQALERYPWLSAQILNRWRRTRAIRSFTGKEGKTVYPKSDLCEALAREMECENEQSPEVSGNTRTSGSTPRKAEAASIGTGTISEADELREKHSLQLIYNRRKKS